MFTSQLVVDGNCKQVDIVRAFGVSAISVKRWVKRYREGPAGFFKSPPERKPRVLTREVVMTAQELLNEGKSSGEVAKTLGLKANTVSKAIGAGRLEKAKKNS